MNGEEKNGLDPEPVTVIVHTKNQDETYILKKDFTGSVTIHLNQGGIAGVERLERIK
jgi:hypothetical protein